MKIFKVIYFILLSGMFTLCFAQEANFKQNEDSTYSLIFSLPELKKDTVKIIDTVYVVNEKDSINIIDSVIYSYRDSLIINYRDSIRIKDSTIYSYEYVKTFLDTNLYKTYSYYASLFFGSAAKDSIVPGIVHNFVVYDSGTVKYQFDKNYSPPDSSEHFKFEWYQKKSNKLIPVNVTASSYDTTGGKYYSPQNAFDGKGYEGNNSDIHRWTAKGLPSWIQADLGSQKNIGKIRISFYAFELKRTYTFELLTSDDNINWSKVNTFTSEPIEWNEWNINVSARYLRFNLISSVNNSALWANIWEIEIYQ